MEIIGNIITIYLGIIFIIAITMFVAYLLILLIKDIKRELTNENKK